MFLFVSARDMIMKILPEMLPFHNIHKISNLSWLLGNVKIYILVYFHVFSSTKGLGVWSGELVPPVIPEVRTKLSFLFSTFESAAAALSLSLSLSLRLSH